MRQNDELCTPADPSSTRASHPKDKHRGCFRVRGQSDLREHLGHHVPVNTLCTRRQAVFGGTDREGLGKYRFDWISWRSSLRAGPADLHSLLRPLRYAPSPTRACRRGHGQAPQTSSMSPTVCICGTSPSISRRFHTAFPATSGGDGIYYINRTDSHASAGRRWGVQAVPGAVALLAEPRGRGHRAAAPPPSPPPARGAAAATDGQDGACADPRMTRLHRCRDFPCVISRSKKG